MTTAGLINYVTDKNRKPDICDDCALVAYDEGIDSWDAQVAFMVNVGDMASDHLCSAKDEPSLGIQCDCGCRTISIFN